MTANLDLISKLEADSDALKAEAEELKNAAKEKSEEARNVRNSIALAVESLVRENGLDALTDKRVAYHINRAFHLRRHDAAPLRELVEELFTPYKNDGAQLQFNTFPHREAEFLIRLQGHDAVIPLPERFTEILEAFGGTLKFVTPDTLTPEYDTTIVEVRKTRNGDYSTRYKFSDLPAKDFDTIGEALNEALSLLKLHFAPERPVTGTFTLA